MIDMDKKILAAAAAALSVCACGRQEVKKPNVVFLLFDDLGYGDLGCYGQEKIETPNIDALASQGRSRCAHLRRDLWKRLS